MVGGLLLVCITDYRTIYNCEKNIVNANILGGVLNIVRFDSKPRFDVLAVLVTECCNFHNSKNCFR